MTSKETGYKKKSFDLIFNELSLSDQMDEKMSDVGLQDQSLVTLKKTKSFIAFEKLQQKGIHQDEQTFYNLCRDGDIESVELFIESIPFHESLTPHHLFTYYNKDGIEIERME